MTSTLMKFLSPTAMQCLAWALLHFLWQGTALAALGAALMSLSRRPRVRYVVGATVLLLMLIAPIATCVLSWQPHSSLAERSQPLTSAWTMANVKHQAIPSAASSSVEPPLGALPWLVEAWLLGVTLFSLRSAGGFLLLERERRTQSTVVEDRVLEICHSAARSAGHHTRDPLLRVRVAAGSGGDRMVSSRRFLAGNRSHGTLRRTA